MLVLEITTNNNYAMFQKDESYSINDVVESIKKASKGNTNITCSLSELKFQMEKEELTVEFPSGDKYSASINAQMSLCKEAGIPFGYYNKCGEDLKIKNLTSRLNTTAKERRFEINTSLKMLRGLVPSVYSEMKNHEPLVHLKGLEWRLGAILRHYISRTNLQSHQ